MRCAPPRRLPFALLLLPLRAFAHLPTSGLGPAYDGMLHLLLSPEDLIPLGALALLCGQRGSGFARRALWLVPLAWAGGAGAGMFAQRPFAPALPGLSFLVLGGLLACNARLSLRAVSALAALFALLHGYRNGCGINRYDDGAFVVIGLGVTVFVVVALLAALALAVRRPWAKVAVRVAGSWIAASGLLVLGWALRG